MFLGHLIRDNGPMGRRGNHSSWKLDRVFETESFAEFNVRQTLKELISVRPLPEIMVGFRLYRLAECKWKPPKKEEF